MTLLRSLQFAGPVVMATVFSITAFDQQPGSTAERSLNLEETALILGGQMDSRCIPLVRCVGIGLTCASYTDSSQANCRGFQEINPTFSGNTRIARAAFRVGSA